MVKSVFVTSPGVHDGTRLTSGRATVAICTPSCMCRCLKVYAFTAPPSAARSALCDLNVVFSWRLQAPGPAPTDVLGSTEATGAAGVMGLFGRGGADAKAELWALGERAAILLHLDAAALIPHVLASRSSKLHLEARPAALSSIPLCSLLQHRVGTSVLMYAYTPAAVLEHKAVGCS